MTDKALRMSIFSLIINIAFSIYHVVFGAIIGSWWLLVLGFYYSVLSAVRFVVVKINNYEQSLTKFTGWMLMIMSLSVVGTVVLSALGNRGQKFDMIPMITIATYTTVKIVLAVAKLIKVRHSASQKIITLRNISLADAFVSVFSLQRSMLVSFEGMSEKEIQLMNILTGSCACIAVLCLGINLVRKR